MLTDAIATLDLELQHGADFALPLQFEQQGEDGEDAPLDLTGYDFQGEIRRHGDLVEVFAIVTSAEGLMAGSIGLRLDRVPLLLLPPAQYRWQLFWITPVGDRQLKIAGGLIVNG